MVAIVSVASKKLDAILIWATCFLKVTESHMSPGESGPTSHRGISEKGLPISGPMAMQPQIAMHIDRGHCAIFQLMSHFYGKHGGLSHRRMPNVQNLIKMANLPEISTWFDLLMSPHGDTAQEM